MCCNRSVHHATTTRSDQGVFVRAAELQCGAIANQEEGQQEGMMKAQFGVQLHDHVGPARHLEWNNSTRRGGFSSD